VKARYWGWALLTALWYPIGAAWAVGLGDLIIRSPIDTPLVAEINILAIGPNEIDDLWVGFASDSDFRRVGIERNNALDDVMFKPTIRNDGSTMVEVFSKAAISQPYLHFLVTLKWTGGQIMREYTLLLDRTVHDGLTPAKIFGPEIPAAELIAQFGADEVSRNVLTAPPMAGHPYGPVKRREYLIGIGNRLDLPNDISIYQRLYAILGDNPHAFIRQNMNLLRAGVVLDIPTAEQMAAVSRVLAMETFIRQVTEWQEYRLETGASSKGAAAFAQESPEMTVMKATMVELEEEIVRLQEQLEEANAQPTQSAIETAGAAQYREQLAEDIRRLEAARDQLLQTIDRLSNSGVLAVQSESDRSDLGISQSGSVGEMDTSIQPPAETSTDSQEVTQEVETTLQASRNSGESSLPRKTSSEMEALFLSQDLESQKLKEQVLLLEKQIQKAVALLVVKDEALSLARQEAAVYGAALEALESTSNEQQENAIKGDANVDAEKVEASVTQSDLIDDAESVSIQEEEASHTGVKALFDESNRPVLLVVGAALLLLLLFLMIRRKRIQGERSGAQQSSRVIDAVPPTTGFVDDSDVASKLDLARAYVEMGDYVLARELLVEVKADGDEDQKAEAQRLSDMLGS
jgi:FimV-like protein